MKTKYYFLAALAAVFASCANEEYVGDTSPTALEQTGDGSIQFGFDIPNMTRAGELKGATAAEKLGRMFVVEGTKGSEATDAPSSTVVFDNYLVGYEYNSAGTTESNTHNWEYVGKQTGITDRMTTATWTSLHNGDGQAKSQTIKYWDYSTSQYDFIAWSTGTCEAIPVPDPAAEPASGKIQVTRINTGATLKTNGFKMTASSAADLLQCYYTDIITAKKDNGAGTDYGKPVTLTFKNMAAKVRVALYETVPGYSVKNVQFYQSDANPINPTDLATDISTNPATLFTMGSDNLPQSGTVTVMYPHIGTENSTKETYNKASVSVEGGSSTSKTQTFGTIPTGQLKGKDSNEANETVYLGRNITEASFAGDADKAFYQPVIPNTNGHPLTLRVNYTLVSTDGSGEEIKVYGAKAVVPATYAVWQPNYAYTYIFKISDNSNGYTSTTSSDPKGLYPITFDAVVTNFTDVNAEQTTVTTVATPSITTYQQGHNHAAKDEYSKSQTAGKSASVKALYVQVMNNSGDPALVTDLNTAGKSLLFKVTGATPISEATVMDALQNHTADYVYNAASPVGRNGLTLTTASSELNNEATSIVNGVNDQPIEGITAGKLAEIDIKNLDENSTYAYVYCTTIPSKDEKVYHVAAATSENFTNYYPVSLTVSPAETVKAAGSKATAGNVYFVPNKDAKGTVESYTFKQTKVNDNVEGLVEKSIPGSKASAGTYDSSTFYFDVYNQNDGEYAVKVFKVVE